MGRYVGLIGVGALSLCACDVDFVSESGRIGFDAPSFHYPAPDKWPSGGSVAVGSEVCLQVDGWFETPGEGFVEDDLAGCFELEHAGVGSLDGECLQLDAPGSATVTLRRTAATCAGDLTDDAVEVQAVAVDELRTSIEFELEALVRQSDDYDTPGYTYDDLVADDPLPLVVGSEVTLLPGLRSVATGELVAWTHGAITSPSAAVQPIGGDNDDDMRARVSVDGPAELMVEVDGVAAAPAQIEAVDPTTLRDFEIVAFVGAGPDDVGALRALARDEQGRPVRGVPASWSVVVGDIALRTSDGPDYAYIEGDCHDPGDAPIEQDVTVEASLMGETRTHAWHYVSKPCASDEPLGEGGEPTGCACRVSRFGGGGWPVAWTMLGVLLAARRRRRR